MRTGQHSRKGSRFESCPALHGSFADDLPPYISTLAAGKDRPPGIGARRLYGAAALLVAPGLPLARFAGSIPACSASPHGLLLL